MKGVLKKMAKNAFKDKFNIDAYHGTRQEVAINPAEAIYDGVPRKILVEEEGAPIKEFLDKSE